VISTETPSPESEPDVAPLTEPAPDVLSKAELSAPDVPEPAELAVPAASDDDNKFLLLLSELAESVPEDPPEPLPIPVPDVLPEAELSALDAVDVPELPELEIMVQSLIQTEVVLVGSHEKPINADISSDELEPENDMELVDNVTLGHSAGNVLPIATVMLNEQSSHSSESCEYAINGRITANIIE
jgi:hypothetical protein